MPSGITLISGILTGAPVALDAKFGPYNSVTDALNDLTSGLRYRGLTVGVFVSGVLKEYWFKDGTENTDFVVKTSDVTWDSLTGKPSTFTPSAHFHAISEVTDLQTTLDGKQASGSYATLVNGTVPESQLPASLLNAACVFDAFRDGTLTPIGPDPIDPSRFVSTTAFVINVDGSISPSQQLSSAIADLCFDISANGDIISLEQ